MFIKIVWNVQWQKDKFSAAYMAVNIHIIRNIGGIF
jgi:hypothetical protein